MARSGPYIRREGSWRFSMPTAAKRSFCLTFSTILPILCMLIFLTGFGSWTAAPGSRATWGRLAGLGHPFQVRKLKMGDAFGTLFHGELRQFFQMTSDKPQTATLIATLKQMQSTGIKTVVFSMSWEWAEPEPGKVRYDYVNTLMDCPCKNTDLKVDLILDVLKPPPWIWSRYHDAKVHDADGRSTYTYMSWFHKLSNDEARRFISDVASHLAKNYTGCAYAIQPVYNNEYEAKYTQEYDSYQDYSPYALLEYRNWLRAKGLGLEDYNVRWGTTFKNWSHVVPPKLRSGDQMGVDFSSQYWDWMKFRVDFGANVFNQACAVVQAAGLKCFHHFPEFFTVIDAIYGAPMFKHIAASKYTDFVIMDSNFRTPYGTIMNPHKLRIYIAAAHSYGKPVYFEAAVERFASFDLLEAGFRNTYLAGAENVGITNWMTRVEMNSSLTKAFHGTPACGADEVVGLFMDLDSCAAFHGLQWKWNLSDPLHDFVEDLAERLSQRCETDVAVFIELDRFLAAMPNFDRVIFVEPLILFNSEQLANYVAVKAELKRIPHEVLYLPINVTTGPQLVVLQELAPVKK